MKQKTMNHLALALPTVMGIYHLMFGSELAAIFWAILLLAVVIAQKNTINFDVNELNKYD